MQAAQRDDGQGINREREDGGALADVFTLGLKGEDLKAAVFAKIDLSDRDMEARQHLVGDSTLNEHAKRAQIGPISLEVQLSQPVAERLMDPKKVGVVTYGRNELRRGFLGPTLQYILESTGNGANPNLFYADGDSDDGSAEYAEKQGFKVFRRSETMKRINADRMAEILHVHPGIFRGENIQLQPQLRKGFEDFSFRLGLWDAYLKGELPEQLMMIDSDLVAVPGGLMGTEMPYEQQYRPLQLMSAAGLFSEMETGRQPANVVIYTGSENRNNEPIMAAANTFMDDVESPFRNAEQRKVAHDLAVHMANTLHPVTGELAVNSNILMSSPGTTAWGVEPARNAYLAGVCAELNGRPDLRLVPAAEVHPYNATVRRGEQQRIDAYVADLGKEWRYCMGDAVVAFDVIGKYAVETGRPMKDWTLEDYMNVNEWLSKLTHLSRIDPATQSKVWEQRSPDRIFPPIKMLIEAGAISM